MDFNSEKFDDVVFVQNEVKDTQENDKSDGPPEQQVEISPHNGKKNMKSQKKSPIPANIDYGHLKAKVQAIV